MRTLAKLLFFAVPVAFGAFGAFVACGDDTAIVRVRTDGGDDGGDGGVQILACGAVVPQTYDGTAFAANTAEELGLRTNALALDQQMAAAEGTGTTIVTSGALELLYAQGTPNLRSSSTSAAQSILDGYFTSFGAAAGKTWTPDDAAAEAGATVGGKYAGGPIVSPTGLVLRGATAKTLLGGAFYNHALVVASGPVTSATVDRFVASFGASPNFADTSDPTVGGPDTDALIAAYASQRDDKSQSTPGSYRRIKNALLSAKAAAVAGTVCSADLAAALSVFFAEWEKVTYASAIYYLNDAASKAIADVPDGPGALVSFGQAVGFIQSFQGVAQDRRKITDQQISDLLTAIGADVGWQLVTPSSAAARKDTLVTAITTIAGIYGFAPGDVQSFEKAF